MPREGPREAQGSLKQIPTKPQKAMEDASRLKMTQAGLKIVPKENSEGSKTGPGLPKRIHDAHKEPKREPQVSTRRRAQVARKRK